MRNNNKYILCIREKTSSYKLIGPYQSPMSIQDIIKNMSNKFTDWKFREISVMTPDEIDGFLTVNRMFGL